jgi:HK97 family phage major capsid protein
MPDDTLTIKVPQTLNRAATISNDGEGDAKQLRISISSDVPYLRYDWWNDREYYEVLDHSPSGFVDTRLRAGLPMLFNHDREFHLGRARKFSCDGKRICVEDIVWSESEAAQEKKRDMDAGVLVDTSVGYSILDEGTCIGEKDGIPVYRFKWEPHEYSLVTIPADVSVGAGRERQKPDGEPIPITIKNSFDNSLAMREKRTTSTNDMPEEIKTEANHEPKIDIVKERNEAASAERKRVKDIREYVANFKVDHMKADVESLANKAIESGESVESFEKSVIANWRSAASAGGSSSIGMSNKEAQSFSVLRAINQLATKGRLEGLEREASDAACKQYGRSIDGLGFIVPDDVTLRSLTRAQTASVATAGGFTVATELGGLIEYLRNKTVLGQLGITMLNGLTGDVSLPVQSSGATAYWVSETGALTDSSVTFGQKKLSPHRLGATIPLSTQLIAQSSISAEAWARNELQTVLALARDLAGLEGTGVNGQPLGVKNTTGINTTVTFGGAATWADVVEFETGIATDNADIGTMGFALSAATVGKWKTILKDSVAGAGYLLSDDMTANGYPAKRTGQITGSIAFFGVWSQLIHAMWAGQEIIVDPYALKKSGQVEVTINELCDFLVRQPLAFNVSTDSAAQ